MNNFNDIAARQHSGQKNYTLIEQLTDIGTS